MGASKKKSGTDANLESVLWKAANKLRNDLDPMETMHVVLGLIFLKSVSDQGTQMPLENRL